MTDSRIAKLEKRLTIATLLSIVSTLVAVGTLLTMMWTPPVATFKTLRADHIQTQTATIRSPESDFARTELTSSGLSLLIGEQQEAALTPKGLEVRYELVDHPTRHTVLNHLGVSVRTDGQAGIYLSNDRLRLIPGPSEPRDSDIWKSPLAWP